LPQAYRKLALAKHPDRGGDPAEFARVSRAYEAPTNDFGIHQPNGSFEGFIEFLLVVWQWFGTFFFRIHLGY